MGYEVRWWEALWHIYKQWIILIVFQDKKVHIYSVASGGLTETQVIDNKDVALDLEYSPDGAYLATAGADRYVRCYTVSDGKVSMVLIYFNYFASVAVIQDTPQIR